MRTPSTKPQHRDHLSDSAYASRLEVAFRLNRSCDDLVDAAEEARDFGQWLVQPDTHYSALFNILNSLERQRLGDRLYRLYLDVASADCTVRQLIAFALFVRGKHARKYNHICRIERPSTADYVDLTNASAPEVTEIDDTLAGRSSRGLAKVFHTTVEAAIAADRRFDAIAFLSDPDHLRITTPEDAVRYISLSRANSKYFEVFRNRAEDVIDEAFATSRHRLIPERRSVDLRVAANRLTKTLSYAEATGQVVLTAQQKMIQPDYLCDRFQLDPHTNVYIPQQKRIAIATSIDDALRQVAEDRSFIHTLSPRGFEEFMRELFTNLGYEVELTKTSRDGGADLICLKDLHGIPIRFAVEIKRYLPHRAIDVSLVRSFVGANAQFKANRLVYVTTSRYTQPARDYAETYLSHSLSLKDYEHLREWCIEARRIQPRLI